MLPTLETGRRGLTRLNVLLLVLAASLAGAVPTYLWMSVHAAIEPGLGDPFGYVTVSAKPVDATLPPGARASGVMGGPVPIDTAGGAGAAMATAMGGPGASVPGMPPPLAPSLVPAGGASPLALVDNNNEPNGAELAAGAVPGAVPPPAAPSAPGPAGAAESPPAANPPAGGRVAQPAAAYGAGEPRAPLCLVESLPAPTVRDQLLLRSLDRVADVDFNETPLKDTLIYLKDLLMIHILLDEVALAEKGIQTDVPITLSMDTARLEKVLQLMLAPLDLTFFIDDGVLQVTTTKDDRQNHQFVRTYPVWDLATEDQLPNLAKVIEASIEPESWNTSGDKPAQTAACSKLVIVEGAASLVIRQTWSTHRKIESLLHSLRQAKSLAPHKTTVPVQ